MDKWPHRVLASLVAAVVILAVVVAVLNETRSPMTVEAGSPEATVQKYVTAVLDRDHERAAAYFDPSGVCDVEDLDNQNYVDRDARVELVDSVVRSGTARVIVRITTPSGGPVPNFLDEEVTFRLGQDNGSWVLTGSPWPMFDCEGVQFK